MTYINYILKSLICSEITSTRDPKDKFVELQNVNHDILIYEMMLKIISRRQQLFFQESKKPHSIFPNSRKMWISNKIRTKCNTIYCLLMPFLKYQITIWTRYLSLLNNVDHPNNLVP